MLDIFEQFATDESHENNGTWVEYGDTEFLVARLGNRKYVKGLSSRVEANKTLLDKGDESADRLSDRLMAETYAESILLGWRTKNPDGTYTDLIKFKGKEVAYDNKNAKDALLLKDFRRLVTGWADDMSRFRAKLYEEQAKN